MGTKTKPVVVLLSERIEVPTVRHGKPAFRWTTGYYVCDPAKDKPLGEAKIYPPVVRKEAYALARELGGPKCKVVIDKEVK